VGVGRNREPRTTVRAARVNSGYKSGIAGLTAAGIKVIGYVATGYTANSLASVKADIDRWKVFYPGQITGIFFDEQSNKAGDVSLLPRSVAVHEGAGAAVHGRQSRARDTAERLRRRARHDADLRERRASLGRPDGRMARQLPAVQLRPSFPTRRRSMRRGWRKRPSQRAVHLPAERQTCPTPWDSVPSYFSDLLAALE